MKLQITHFKLHITGSLDHLVTLSVFLCFILLIASTASAQTPVVNTTGRAGNYCVECHVSGDARLASAFEWQGGIGREQVSPCPTLKKLREQVYYTDSLLGALTNAGQGLRASGVSTAPMDKRVTARLETYSRITHESVTALVPVVTELQSLRLQMNKSYSQMYTGWEAVNTRWAILAAAAATLLLAGTAIWRLFNYQLSIVNRKLARPSPLAFVAVVIVFLLFALPVFSTAAPASTAQTAEQAARQTALNEADKAAQAAETASARAWILARIGASWAGVDKAKGQAALAAGLEAFDEFQKNAPAYWGRVRQLEEDAVTWTGNREDAAAAADRIAVAASRAWALRAMAGDVAGTDRARAVELLTQARAIAEENPKARERDLDLYGIAVEWARLDGEAGAGVARAINDPALRAAAFRDMRQFDQALQAARGASPVEQVAALGELGVRWAATDKVKGAEVLNEALSLANQVKAPEARAFGLRNLAAAWAVVDPAQAARMAASIDAAYPEIKANALLEAGQFDQAVEQVRRIDQAYRRDRALAAIARARAASALDKALEIATAIQDDHLRADVQRAAALGFAGLNPDKALQIAQTIPSSFLRADAFTRLGAFDPAFALADQLQDTYPMKELAVAWARTDPDRALQAVEKIQRDVDRAEALREIAVLVAARDKTQAAALFERAFSAAQAMRRSGDPFASAEALRQLGAAWAAIDKDQAGRAFTAAFEAAQRISVKY